MRRTGPRMQVRNAAVVSELTVVTPERGLGWRCYVLALG